MPESTTVMVVASVTRTVSVLNSNGCGPGGTYGVSVDVPVAADSGVIMGDNVIGVRSVNVFSGKVPGSPVIERTPDEILEGSVAEELTGDMTEIVVELSEKIGVKV